MMTSHLDRSEYLSHLRTVSELAGVRVENFALPESGFCSSGDLRLHYLDWHGQGPNVLFLHGGGLNAHTWDVVALGLRPRYRVVALDQRGHGDSDWSSAADYSPPDHAGDVGALMDHLGWDTCFLVGMSMGGINALQFASMHSDRLDGLVVVDVGPDIQWDGAELVRSFMSTKRIGSLDDHVSNALKFNPRRDPEVLQRSLRHNLRPSEKGLWEWKYDPQPLFGPSIAEMERAHRDLWEVVPGVSAPTLVIRGTESDVFSPHDARRLVQTLPQARLGLVRAGHTVQGDNPRDLLDLLQMFFESCQFRAATPQGGHSSASLRS